MFSVIKNTSEAQILNMDYLGSAFRAKGFELVKQKNKDLEGGLNIVSFHIEKNGIFMTVFVMKVDKNLYVCGCYYHGVLVQQVEAKYPSDIPDTIMTIFSRIKVRKEDEPIRFDLQLQNLRQVAEKVEQRQKNVNNFTEEVKTSRQYQHLKKAQKQLNEKVVRDYNYIIENKDMIKSKNNSLIDSLMKIEVCKQTLHTSLIAYEQESLYASNVKERLKEQLQSIKKKGSDISPGNLNEMSLNQYLANLVQAKKLELQQKFLIA